MARAKSAFKGDGSMSWLNNLKVAQKLALLISVLIIALVCVSGTGYYFLKKTNNNVEAMYNESLTTVHLITENRVHARRIEANLFSLMLTTNDAENQALLAEISKRAKAFDENLTKVESMQLPDSERAQLKEIRDTLTKYRAVRTDVLALAAANKNAEAYTLYKEKAEVHSLKFTELLTQFSEIQVRKAMQMRDNSASDFSQATVTFIALALAATFIGLFLGILIIKRITGRLNDIVQFITTISTGDFSHDVSDASLTDQSEFGDVSRAVATMNTNIRNLMKQVSNTSEQLAASSEELTASADQSAQASNQVAASITDVAQGADTQLRLANNANAEVEKMSVSIQQVAKNTQIVSASAEKTATTANAGEQTIEKAVSQMSTIEEKTTSTARVIGELEEKSQQIGQIVEVISAISGQTNLLALNAAIEAARAGEAGRGFAVVAEEVRKLAEQSQEAAKQITDLISEVQAKTNHAVTFMNDGKKEVDSGAAVVGAAGQSFREILQMIREITSQIQGISKAIEEISKGTQHVVDAVQKIDQESKNAAAQTQTISAATEEQSASVEEIASASRHLAQMAEGLQEEIRRFKV
jgi:methyl-accepting chemotaxis protein